MPLVKLRVEKGKGGQLRNQVNETCTPRDEIDCSWHDSRAAAAQMLHGLYRYRSFIWTNAVGELRHRYAGTNLGVVWNVLHPLALIAVYGVVFTQVFARTQLQRPIPGVSDAVSFLLYLTSALLPWLAFAECVTRGCNAFSDNAAYLKKLPIPEQVFVAQSAAAATLGLVISFSLLLALSLALGLRPRVEWLLLPLPLLAFQILGFGIGLLCGTLNVFFRDVGQLVAVILQLALWTVPVVYPKEILPSWVQSALLWHPLYPPIAGIRELFLYGQIPPAPIWTGMIVWPAVVCALAALAFRALRTEIRDLL
jgi:ABC-type polysaccharide/polyol phosphate export permease